MVCEGSTQVGAARHWFAAFDTPPFADREPADRQRLMGEIVRYSLGNCDQSLIEMWMDESADMFAFVDGIMNAAGAVVIADENDMPGGMGGTSFYTPPFEHHYADENGDRKGIEERNMLFEKHINEAGYEVSYGYLLAKLVREEGGRALPKTSSVPR